jgi:hypothetical protein
MTGSVLLGNVVGRLPLHIAAPLFSVFHMADSRSTACAITTAARASLRLVNSSSGLLSLSQLFTVESELRSTLAVVHGQIQAMLSGAFS